MTGREVSLVEGHGERATPNHARTSSDSGTAGLVSPELRSLLVCPLDQGQLQDVEQTLVCRVCGRVFPVEDGTPDMVVRAMD